MRLNDRNKAIAIVCAIVFHAVVLLVLLSSHLHFTPVGGQTWPPVDSSEILFGGEYVMLGDVARENVRVSDEPAPQSSDNEAAAEANDMTDEGAAGEPSTLVSTERESPAKVQKKPVPEKKGPTKEELAQREREKRQREAAERINDRVKFGGKGRGSGKSGSPDGNSNVGAVSGSPGHNLKGRSIAYWGKPSSTLAGVLRIKVSVNKQGKVVGTPVYVGGSGPAAANLSVRRSCISASKASQFSVALDGPATQTGVITWRFE